MTPYFYDLHIHSCLSPCADDESTPANIAGMAIVNGLQIAALTDHNTTANCPAFFAAARTLGLIPIAGMELTTAEDIHVVCLLPSLEAAAEWQMIVDRSRIRVRNKPLIFGNQYIMDAEDNIIGVEEDLLINATTLTLDEAFRLCHSLGGVSYPAHIDRTSNGAVAVLGAFPEDTPYTAYELRDAASAADYCARFPSLGHRVRIISSDAHELGAISEAENSILLDDEPYSSARVTAQLFARLRGDIQ